MSSIALLFTLFPPFISCIHAQTLPAQATQSNGAKQSPDIEASPVPPVSSADQTIPLPQIADRAVELDQLLRQISGQLIPKSELLELERKAEEQASEIRQRVTQTRDLMADEPTTLDLEDEQRYWRSRSNEYATERGLLTMRAGKLQEQIQTLDAQQKEWVATWVQIHKSKDLEAIVERIKQQTDKIQAAKAGVQAQLNVVLTVQNQVLQQDQQISEILLRVRQEREQERGRLLEQDGRPLWQARESQGVENNFGQAFHRSMGRSFSSAKGFVGAHILLTFVSPIFYLLALFGVFKLRHYLAHTERPQVSTETLQVLDRPFSVALLVALIGTGQYLTSAPIGIAFVYYLLYLVPVLRLLALLTEPRFRIFLYVLATFYVLGGVYLLIQLPSFYRREVYALLLLSALVSFGWLARPSRMGRLIRSESKGASSFDRNSRWSRVTGNISAGKYSRICFPGPSFGAEYIGWNLRGGRSFLRRPRLDLNSWHRLTDELGALPARDADGCRGTLG